MGVATLQNNVDGHRYEIQVDGVLAGFAEDTDSQGQRLLIDNHGAAVDSAVWALYWQVLKRIGPMATLIERDNHLPALNELLIEAQRADHMIQTSKVRV